MRTQIRELAKKLAKINPKFAQQVTDLADSVSKPKDYILIDIDRMEATVNPDKVSDDIEIPKITVE
jgi:hypothetical protein